MAISAQASTRPTEAVTQFSVLRILARKAHVRCMQEFSLFFRISLEIPAQASTRPTEAATQFRVLRILARKARVRCMQCLVAAFFANFDVQAFDLLVQS